MNYNKYIKINQRIKKKKEREKEIQDKIQKMINEGSKKEWRKNKNINSLTNS